MKTTAIFLLLTSLLACVPSGRLDAQGPGLFDQAKSAAVSTETLPSFYATGEMAADVIHRIVDATDLEPAGKALRIEVTEEKTPWSMGMNTVNTQAVAKGDVMLATFQMRNLKSMTGQALVMFSFQKGEPDWDKSVWKQVTAGSEWTRISLPFVMKDSYPAGKAMAGFHLSLDDQTIEIADFQVLNFGPDFDLAALPNSDKAYEGREPDAPWRAVAAERIEKHRKADLTVTVLDADGQPVPDAKVTVEMTRHAFPFGTAIAVPKLIMQNADGDRYRQEILNNFNAGGFESAMKWPFYDVHYPADDIAESLSWLVDHDITVRGHVLMWPSWRWIHPDAIALKDDLPALRQAIEDWVIAMTTRYRGRVDEWDAVNEAYSNHDILDIFGEEVMVDWYKLAHAANPEATLYINDNEMVTSGGRITKHLVKYKQQIQMLLDHGAPLHGIGVQGHFAAGLSSPEQVWKSLDQLAEFGLPIKVTEFDINNEDPQLQADFLRDFYTAAFAHESVAGIQMWGFWEGQHWRPDAALFDKDWNLRPHGQAYRDLVYDQWWTQDTGTTNPAGHFTTRGFLGDYRITVTTPDNQTHEATATLAPQGETVVFTVSPRNKPRVSPAPRDTK